ncbi:MAG: divalent-cation tolerance protein CutA [Rhodospirillaceae bacterium]
MAEPSSEQGQDQVMLVYMTAGSQEEAMHIAQALIAERLAACVNILAPMTAVFHWDGGVQTGAEVPFLAKTTAAGVAALTDRVVALHSYDCPCIVAWPLEQGHSAFLSWVGAETRS